MDKEKDYKCDMCEDGFNLVKGMDCFHCGNTKGELEKQKYIEINQTNINRLQKKYNHALKNKNEMFICDGSEILTSYAKYLLQYMKGLKVKK